jgi:hypothetical protein
MNRKIREVENLARLGAELPLLAELIAVEVPVHPQVCFARNGALESLDCCVPGPGGGLVGREADARDADGILERTEDASKLDRRAVRVRDDSRSVAFEGAVIHARDDKWHVLREPVRV